MTVTIGLVANVYNEINALPGWLETHLPFFDDVRVMHAGPFGEYSNDGTMELLSKWCIPTQFCSIDEGFGAVRSRTLRMSPCDYIMLLDADERFYPLVPVLDCSGQATPHSRVDEILRGYDFRTRYPNWDEIAELGSDLKVERLGIQDQGKCLRELLQSERPDVVCTVRRHWHDFSMKRPTQNWKLDCDWQLRLVRNHPSIKYDSDKAMHEQLIGAEKAIRASANFGPFFDHFHFMFKRMEQEQRAHDVAIYDKIHAGERPPTWQEFKGGAK